MEKKNSIISGVVLILAGLVGLIFGKDVKRRSVKIAVLAISFVSIGGGYYLLVSGLSKDAVKQIDGESNKFIFASPQDFREKLDKYRDRKAVQQGKSIRRLTFACVDQSEKFTVYLTDLGVWNVPENDVVCKDGSNLLSYKETK